ncbi:YbbR-like domain-containing protein [Metabacillus sp. RGM 3146]|uniref:CdaR family protein n=1 Tax=Metabacillus sp. RGM 3146 TaxID=3401092 RepID=UPI003B9AF579
MDKWINNNWFVRIIALFLALLLYISVPENSNPLIGPSKQSQTNQESTTSTSTNDTSGNITKVVDSVPVKAYFDNENYIVYGLPDEIAVTLNGPLSDVTKASVQKDFEVYADLEGLKPGNHKIKLKYRNLNSNIKMDMSPSTATVSIERKITKSFPVKVDFVNSNQIASGYKAGTPVVNPKTVEVTGPERVVESIAEAKARVNLQGANNDISQNSDVTLYDRRGNILPVSKISPSGVSITVPISSPGKQLPVNVIQTGTPQDGITIKDIQVDPKEITAYGPEDVLNSLTKIDDIRLDISKIKDDSTINLDVPVPEGIKEVYPKQIQVKVNVDKQKADVPASADKQETKVLKGIPIKTTGMDNTKQIEFLTPSVDALDVTVTGTSAELNKVSSSDFALSIDVSGLDDGDHTVKINASGPKNAAWKLPQEEAKIRISSQLQTDSSQS